MPERWPALLTLSQAAEYLGFGETFIKSLRASGELSSVRVRSSIRFRRSDLDKFVDELPEAWASSADRTSDYASRREVLMAHHIIATESKSVEWVRTEDESPDDEIIVLVALDGDEPVWLAYHDSSTGGWHSPDGMRLCCRVTHWAELPEVPSE